MTVLPRQSCPVCGAYSLTQDGWASTLLAVADVLVLKALEALGKRLVRADRSRFAVIEGRPFYLAHTIWLADDGMVEKALRGAWDVVPALLDGRGPVGATAAQVTALLDSYVHDLAVTRYPHRISDLAERLSTRLGLPVYLDADARAARALDVEDDEDACDHEHEGERCLTP